MKTIIAGSRDISNEDFLTALYKCPFLAEITVVISGTARGADKYGESWAEWKNIPIIRMPADWSKGRSAGHIRNSEMNEIGDSCIVIWDGYSPGSKGMINLVKHNEKMEHIFVWNLALDTCMYSRLPINS